MLADCTVLVLLVFVFSTECHASLRQLKTCMCIASGGVEEKQSRRVFTWSCGCSYYINPLSWTLYGIIVTQLGDETSEVRASACY